MREILFKAKRIDNVEWIEGFFIKAGDKAFIVSHAELRYYEVDPYTLCQYTGLTDKNGQKIWENDIVKNIFGESYAQIKYGSYSNCYDSIKAEHIGFYVDWKDNSSIRKDLGYWVNMVNAEIIGNMFGNSELLEGDAE